MQPPASSCDAMAGAAASLPPLLRLPAELLLAVFDQLEETTRRLNSLLEVSTHPLWQRALLSKSRKTVTRGACADILDGVTGSVQHVVCGDALMQALARHPDMYARFDSVLTPTATPACGLQVLVARWCHRRPQTSLHTSRRTPLSPRLRRACFCRSPLRLGPGTFARSVKTLR